MTVTAAQIAEVRRLVAEPTVTTYSDALITTIIEKYPMIDELGSKPYYWNYVAGVQTKVVNTNWIETYDLNAACSQIWREKAAAVVMHFDFNADGADYKQSQEYIQADAMARLFQSKSTIKTITQIAGTDADDPFSWIGNLPEPEL
jgi:hypothetical protein